MEATEMREAWKLADTLRARVSGPDTLAELARVGLVRRELGLGSKDELPTNRRHGLLRKFLSIANDPTWNRRHGFTSFFPLDEEALTAIGEDVLTLGDEALESHLLSCVRGELARGDLFDFPVDLFNLAVSELRIGSGHTVLVPVVENCFSLVRMLIEKHPKAQFLLYYRTQTVAPFVHLLFSEAQNVSVKCGSLDSGFDEPFPDAEFVIYLGAFNRPIRDEVIEEEVQRRHFPSCHTTTSFFLSRFLRESKLGSVLISHLPEPVLSSSPDNPIRQAMVVEGIIKRITQLPAGTLRPVSHLKSNLLEFVNGGSASKFPTEFVRLDCPARVRSGWEFNQANVTRTARIVPQASLAQLGAWNIDRVLSDSLEFFKSDTKRVLLATVATDIYRGAPISALKDQGADASIVRVVNYKDLRDPVVDVSTLTAELVASSRPLNRYYLQHGDLVVTSRGPISAVLRVSLIWGHTKEPVVPSTNLAVIRVDKSKIDSVFLLHFFLSEAGQSALLARQSGSTLMMLSTKELSSIEVPMLPLAEQKRIAERLQRAAQEYDSAVRHAKSVLDKEVRASYDLMGLKLGEGK